MNGAEELQRLASLVEMNKARLEEVGEQSERIYSVISEHESAIISLSAISSGKGGHLPIGAGIMIPLSSTVEQNFLVDIGSGIIAEKNHKETIVLLEARIEELNVVLQKMGSESQILQSEIKKLSLDFNDAANKFKSPSSEEATTENATDLTNEKPKRQTRRFGSELTLDD
jgi:prefoldin alpha subunit